MRAPDTLAAGDIDENETKRKQPTKAATKINQTMYCTAHEIESGSRQELYEAQGRLEYCHLRAILAFFALYRHISIFLSVSLSLSALITLPTLPTAIRQGFPPRLYHCGSTAAASCQAEFGRYTQGWSKVFGPFFLGRWWVGVVT